MDDLLGVVDQSFTDVGNPKNINEVTKAINFSDSLQNNYYSGQTGQILGYDAKGKLKVIPESTFNKLIQKGEEGGAATKNVNKIIEQDSAGIQEGLKNTIEWYSKNHKRQGHVDESSLLEHN